MFFDISRHYLIYFPLFVFISSAFLIHAFIWCHYFAAAMIKIRHIIMMPFRWFTYFYFLRRFVAYAICPSFDIFIWCHAAFSLLILRLPRHISLREILLIYAMMPRFFAILFLRRCWYAAFICLFIFDIIRAMPRRDMMLVMRRLIWERMAFFLSRYIFHRYAIYALILLLRYDILLLYMIFFFTMMPLPYMSFLLTYIFITLLLLFSDDDITYAPSSLLITCRDARQRYLLLTWKIFLKIFSFSILLHTYYYYDISIYDMSIYFAALSFPSFGFFFFSGARWCHYYYDAEIFLRYIIFFIIISCLFRFRYMLPLMRICHIRHTLFIIIIIRYYYFRRDIIHYIIILSPRYAAIIFHYCQQRDIYYYFTFPLHAAQPLFWYTYDIFRYYLLFIRKILRCHIISLLYFLSLLYIYYFLYALRFMMMIWYYGDIIFMRRIKDDDGDDIILLLLCWYYIHIVDEDMKLLILFSKIWYYIWYIHTPFCWYFFFSFYMPPPRHIFRCFSRHAYAGAYVFQRYIFFLFFQKDILHL